jgi:Sec-independent protein translocase protein TatA
VIEAVGEGIRGFKSAMKAEEEKPVSTTTTVTGDQAITKE